MFYINDKYSPLQKLDRRVMFHYYRRADDVLPRYFFIDDHFIASHFINTFRELYQKALD